MGNGLGKLGHCFSGGGGRRRQVCAAVTSEPYDENVGHSFFYVRPDRLPSAGKVHDCAAEAVREAETTTFRAISGASVSANAFTPLSTSLLLNELTWPAAAAFESSDSFSAVPLQPVPRFPSGPLSGPIAERGFLSGPIERGFMSGPLDHQAALFSGPLDKAAPRLPRSLSHGLALRPRSSRMAASLLRGLSRAISRAIPGGYPSTIAPKDSEPEISAGLSSNPSSEAANGTSVEEGGNGSESSSGVQWAQGKAGEDRVHVVVSEEHGWVFVGIYDGFNGPDAADYLLSNLYSAVQRELKGLLWEDKFEGCREPSDHLVDTLDSDVSIPTSCREGSKKSPDKRTFGGAAKKSEQNQRKWKCQWDQGRLELERRLKEQLSSSEGSTVSHHEVLKALSRALRKTEEAYLDIADEMVVENPELALMGSCVLVMLMKGEDVYLMNVGDSRAILAHKAEPDMWGSVERIKEEMNNGEDRIDGLTSLVALQLTLDHSTCVEEEVRRIRNEHPDDASSIVNDRVKGSLKVTRAFGAGFLKQSKWNDALLEMFRIDYVGTSPYITCSPSLYHHRLGSKDRFLILSSDGLYQYLTNEEAVAQVELFIATSPDGDPAQHLVEEVLFRAAEKAGMDFHELLEIPQGDRRRYHDDVSIIVISLEGRIWRSGV